MNPKLKARLKGLLNILWHLPPCSDIYMFHHVTLHPEVERSCCKLDTAAFEKFLDRHGPYASLEQVALDKSYGGLSAITFDDGLEDTYTLAYPILKRRQIPFTVFVLSHMVGVPGYLTRQQLLELAADPLVTIGVHGSRHRILTQCSPEEQAEEIFKSREVLEALVGKPCDLFAYSHGQYNDTIRKLTAYAGYRMAFAVAGRPLNRRFDQGPYAFPRESVEEETWPMFGL